MPDVILITGCSKGFGYLFALTLARAGYQVVATSRSLSRTRPRFHYSIGATARLVFALRKLLPDSWFLKIEAALVNR